METAKFDIFSFDQISLINFLTNRKCFNSSNWFDEKHATKMLNHHMQGKRYKNKTTNEWTWMFLLRSYESNALKISLF